MKQSRRQELKSNDLSVKLQEAYKAIQRNSNYVIGGAVAVVAILIVALVVQRNRQAAIDQAERTYLEIQSGNVMEKPELIDQAGRLADEQGLDSPLGTRAAELQANLAYQLGMSAGLKDREKMTSRLKQAKGIYEHLLAQKPSHVSAAGWRMGLAATEESLFIADAGGSKDGIRKLYQEVIDGPASSFQAVAKERLESMDARLAKLTIVATQPASAPTPLIIPTTLPAAMPTSAPTAAPTTAPASSPG